MCSLYFVSQHALSCTCFITGTQKPTVAHIHPLSLPPTLHWPYTTGCIKMPACSCRRPPTRVHRLPPPCPSRLLAASHELRRAARSWKSCSPSCTATALSEPPSSSPASSGVPWQPSSGVQHSMIGRRHSARQEAASDHPQAARPAPTFAGQRQELQAHWPPPRARTLPTSLLLQPPPQPLPHTVAHT